MHTLNITFCIISGLILWFTAGIIHAARMDKPIYEKDTMTDKLICLPIFLFAMIFDKACQDQARDYLFPRPDAQILDFEAYKKRKKIS